MENFLVAIDSGFFPTSTYLPLLLVSHNSCKKKKSTPDALYGQGRGDTDNYRGEIPGDKLQYK